MVYNKKICMLICVNQNNRKKMNYLKTNLNRNININIKHLRKSNPPGIKNPSTRKPGLKTPHSTRSSIDNPKQVI